MEILCIDDKGSSRLTLGKVYTYIRNYNRNMVIISEVKGAFFARRFTINPLPNATEEMKKQLRELWGMLTKMR